ncbi:hypothetical protein Geob_3188 [Geotalea daltonii FRC-32]|uniref:Uncharacterized protein n=1 Tax=Geotalea daltonii (strain DSM 22248 / JCM 15807 / FRC-32) TaxID=316067 RepID=B9M476_GEODF|nr:hypothetical protein [Geotalea daltonii]ACM21531.1 hypothetical protein Geob_3188 [Geotalea daltonii FRC-32]
MSNLPKIVIIILLPVLTFYAGSWFMGKLSNRQYVEQRLQQQLRDPQDQKPLNQRYCGYDAAAVGRHWGTLDQTALQVEKCSLRLDLVFPLFYGAAFFASLLLAWAALGSPFHFSWLAAPVGIAVLADWAENSLQLMQLQHFIDEGASGLQQCYIRIASAATIIKLYAIWVVIVLLLVLVAWMIIRTIRSV